MSTQIEKALELINTFATGDAEKAANLLNENYIHHNLAEHWDVMEAIAAPDTWANDNGKF